MTYVTANKFRESETALYRLLAGIRVNFGACLGFAGTKSLYCNATKRCFAKFKKDQVI